jgi:hypothetical protein
MESGNWITSLHVVHDCGFVTLWFGNTSCNICKNAWCCGINFSISWTKEILKQTATCKYHFKVSTLSCNCC